MKTRVWKLDYLDGEENIYEVFDRIELLSDDDLLPRLKQAIIDGQLGEDIIDDLQDKDIESFTPEQIAQVFEDDGYTIQAETIGGWKC